MMPFSHERNADVVDKGIARFMLSYEAERLRLYRLHLQVTVTEVSPVAIDLATGGGFDLDEVASRLPLPKGWPWPHAYDPSAAAHGITRTGYARRPPARSLVDFPLRRIANRLRLRGVLMRDPDDEFGVLGYMVAGGELEVVARLGPCVLHVAAGAGRLLLPGPLPVTVVTGLKDSLIDEVVDHPLLRDRGYRISGVRASERDVPTITFETGTVPHELPWADLLRGAAELEA